MNRGSTPTPTPDAEDSETSMRPRFMNRGSFDDVAVIRCGVERTSMRPRFMNRGSDESVKGDMQIMPTSMRPRFMNRGSTR